MEGTKILVVEDNEDNRQILVLRLRHWGAVDIHEATSGPEALHYLTRELPDLILLDLKLPGVDGLEVARRVRTLPGALSQLPIIAVTAYIHIWDKAAAMAAGCDEYIAKPINFGELHEKLEQVLTPRRPA